MEPIPSLELIPYLRIAGKRVQRFRGCGGCPKADHDCQQTLKTTRLQLKHTGNERWDNWGHIVPVFRLGELVEVEITHDDNFIYCASATSTIYPETSDYIDLANFREE